MNRTKFLKGACQLCGGHLEFPADHIGTIVPCPHCSQDTELLLLPPPEHPTVSRRALIWTAIAVVILALGLGAALVALQRAQKWAQRQKQPAPVALAPSVDPETNQPGQPSGGSSAAPEGIEVSTVTLEKTPGSSLVYAVGTLKNISNRQRFGLKVELELSNAAGLPIGTASDYRQVLDPAAEWQFKALVVDSKAVSATITSIKEE